MSASWEPIDHRPPLPRIETSPRYTQPGKVAIENPPGGALNFERFRAKEADRVWQTVIDAARTA